MSRNFASCLSSHFHDFTIDGAVGRYHRTCYHDPYQQRRFRHQGLRFRHPRLYLCHFPRKACPLLLLYHLLRKACPLYFGAIAKRNNCSLYQATKANTERWSLLSILALGFVTTLPYYINGHYWALLVLPPLTHVLLFSYWHDSLHYCMSQYWRINASLPYLLPGWSSP